MRKPLIAVTVITVGLFGAGGLISQLQGPSAALAAAKHATKAKTTTKTTKKSTSSHATGTATGTGTPHADGKVTKVSGNTITVQPDNDPPGSTEYTKVTTIQLTDATTYKGSTTKASIVPGANIVAEGAVSSDGTTLTATSVSVGGQHGPRGGHGGPHADGTVVSLSGDTVTVKPDNDPAGSQEYTKVTTVLLTTSTTFDGSTTRAAIVPNAEFEAEGTLSADGTTLTATRFGIRGSGGPNAGHFHP